MVWGKNNSLYCSCSFCEFKIVQNKIHFETKLAVSFKENNSNRKEKEKITPHQEMQCDDGRKMLSCRIPTWIPFPSKQNALSSKLPTQVENKVRPRPFQTRRLRSLFLFHSHRQAPERLYKSKFQEKEKVTFPIPLLSRRWFVLFVFINATF